MRTMYDAVTAKNISTDAAIVAGYIDKIKLEPWSAADWARFPNALKVRIVKKASTNDGHVLDVEPGDATAAEAPGWAAMRRASGFAYPVVYCNESTWPSVQAAFTAQNVAQPLYWIAHYDGVAELPTLNGITAIAKQYLGDVAPGIDVSCVADYWPGVDPAPSPSSTSTPDEEEDDMITVPKGGADGGIAKAVSYPLALSMLFEHDVVIAPGSMPVVLYAAYNWGWTGDTAGETHGTGGNPIADSNKPKVIWEKGSYSFIVPKGTGKCDLVYWADDDFAVTIARRS